MNSKQQAKSDRQRHARFSGTVKELAAPGVTFGYIGKCERWGDDRLFAIFLPHPGRVGSLADSVSIGRTEKLPEAVTNWHALAGLARRRYHDGSKRASYKRRHVNVAAY